MFEKEKRLKRLKTDADKTDIIEAPYAWDKIQGANTIGGNSNNTVVAVIDSGIDVNHEAFGFDTPQPNIWINPNQDPSKQDLYGYNFDDGNNDLTDKTGHGTAVAGVLDAIGNNGKGMAGIAWNIKMAPLKATNITSICKAIDYARNHGFPIVCLSQGFYDIATVKPADLDILRQKIEAYPGLFIVAAMNNNKDLDDISTFCYPAKFGCHNMIVVGGVNNDGSRWVISADSGSNYGNLVDIYAPADCIQCPFPNNDYKVLSGTSLAAPMVAGAAAMLYANGVRDIHELKDCIINNAKTIGEIKVLNIARLFPYRGTKYSIPV